MSISNYNLEEFFRTKLIWKKREGQTKIQGTLAAQGRKSVSPNSVFQFALSCSFNFNSSIHALPCQERKTLGRLIKL
jgi:hypothetical protein